MKVKRLNFIVPPEVHKKLRVMAAMTDKTMTLILVDYINEMYDKYEWLKKEGGSDEA